MQLKEYHEVTLREFAFAMDALVRDAVEDVIHTERWNLDGYLAALDSGTFECLAANDITIKFHKVHNVTASIDLNDEDNHLPWVFLRPLEMEVSAVFEAILDN